MGEISKLYTSEGMYQQSAYWLDGVESNKWMGEWMKMIDESMDGINKRHKWMNRWINEWINKLISPQRAKVIDFANNTSQYEIFPGALK